MTLEEQVELKEFCLNIFAHAAIDSEVNIPTPRGGMNGVNSSEASTIAEAILHMFNLKVSKNDIKKAAKYVAKQNGFSDEDIKDMLRSF